MGIKIRLGLGGQAKNPRRDFLGFARERLNRLGGDFLVDPVEGVLDEFGRILQGQLLLDVFAVSLDGPNAEVQFGGDLAGAAAFADQTKNLQFPVGEMFDR